MAASAHLIGQALAKRGVKMLVIETSDDGVEKARQDGAEVLVGNAADPEILTAANVAGARRLFVTIPEPFEAGQAVQQARAANPTLDILARAHSTAAVDHLSRLGANLVVLGEAEIADRMVERAQGKNGRIFSWSSGPRASRAHRERARCARSEKTMSAHWPATGIPTMPPADRRRPCGRSARCDSRQR